MSFTLFGCKKEKKLENQLEKMNSLITDNSIFENDYIIISSYQKDDGNEDVRLMKDNNKYYYVNENSNNKKEVWVEVLDNKYKIIINNNNIYSYKEVDNSNDLSEYIDNFQLLKERYEYMYNT